MYTHHSAPVEALAIPGADADGNTDLDYSTSYHVEGDILTCIHSLLLSSQACYPPRTPWPSNEIHSGYQEDHVASRFDFNTAKSVARHARQMSGKFRLAVQPDASSTIRAAFSSEARNQSPLRSNSPTRDSRVPERFLGADASYESGQTVDDVAIHNTSLTCCPPCSEREEKKSFKLPRLVLQDKDSSRGLFEIVPLVTGVFEPNSRPVEHNPVRHQDPSDTTSFYDLKTISPSSVNQESKAGDILNVSPQLVSKSNGKRIMTALTRELSSIFEVASGSSKPETLHDPAIHSRICDAHSIDVSEVEDDRNELPEQQAVVRAVTSQRSLQQKGRAISLLSSASRSSASRHALLKPPVTDLQTYDFGLPVPPILTNAHEISPVKGSFNTLINETGDRHDLSRSVAPSKTVSALTTSKPNNDTAGDISVGISEPSHQDRRRLANVGQSAHNVLHHLKDHKAGSSEEGAGTFRDLARVRASSIAPQKQRQDSPAALTTIDEHWGFRPNIKLAGTEAVQQAIGRATHEDVMPPGMQDHPTLNVYSRVAAESVGESVRTTDEHIERSPFGIHQLPMEPRDSGHIESSSIHPGLSETDPLVVVDPALTQPDTGQRLLDTHQKQSGSLPQVHIQASLGSESRSRTSITDLHALLGAGPLDAKSFENLTPYEAPIRRAMSDSDIKKYNGKTVPWKHPGRADTSPKHTGIPARKSSLEPKNSNGKNIVTAKLSPRKKSSTGAPRANLIEQLVMIAAKKLHSSSSMSSVGSIAPSSPIPEVSAQDAGKQLLGSSRSQLSLRWLRDILADGQAPSARLTSLPSRNYRQATVLRKPTSSITAPNHIVEKSREDSTRSELPVSETFARTIDDLELLLNEALHIARQAAEIEDNEPLPSLLNDARVFLQNGRGELAHKLYKQDTDKDIILPPVEHLPDSDNSSLSSVHESVRNFSNDSSSQSSYMIMTEDHGYKHPRSPRPPHHLPVRRPIVTPPVFSKWPSGNEPSHCPTSNGVFMVSRDSVRQIIEEDKYTGKFYVSTAGESAPMERSGDSSNSLGIPDITIKGANPMYVAGGRDEQQSEFAFGEKHKPAVRDLKSEEWRRRDTVAKQAYEEDDARKIKVKPLLSTVPNKREVVEYIRVFHQPPVHSRHSSLAVKKNPNTNGLPTAVTSAVDYVPSRAHSENGSSTSSRRKSEKSSLRDTESELDLSPSQGFRRYAGKTDGARDAERYKLKDSSEGEDNLPRRHISGHRMHDKIKSLKHDKFAHLNLKNRSHISLRGHISFSLSRSYRRQPIARDWSPGRKRFVASVACISTGLIGILIGIYAGEVPSIQYYIADFNHYAILGNVFFFIGLAVTNFAFWPLPLLHGRKPYILTAMTIAMPLLFPQAIAVSVQRSPYVETYRVGLILPRAFMGCALGFANMNFMATLTDLFGASLQSGNPHQETVDEFDVRRHGGGLGVWLGIWTWCYMGSIGVGFLIGASIINTLSPDWGFYVAIIIIAAVLLLNVVTPEVRRSAYRRSIAEVRHSKEVSHRLARGEVMMHRIQTGPKWWGEEFHQGILLSRDMMRQPGFLIMSLYVAWIYGQIVLVIVVSLPQLINLSVIICLVP